MARLIMLDRRMVHGNLAEINQGHKVGTNGISLRYLFKFEEALPPGPITTEQVRYGFCSWQLSVMELLLWFEAGGAMAMCQ